MGFHDTVPHNDDSRWNSGVVITNTNQCRQHESAQAADIYESCWITAGLGSVLLQRCRWIASVSMAPEPIPENCCVHGELGARPPLLRVATWPASLTCWP
jgi:hypothetical protein